jgi:hypothetical protein
MNQIQSVNISKKKSQNTNKHCDSCSCDVGNWGDPAVTRLGVYNLDELPLSGVNRDTLLALLPPGKAVPTSALADQLSVSVGTLRARLGKLREILAPYGWTIPSTHRGARLVMGQYVPRMENRRDRGKPYWQWRDEVINAVRDLGTIKAAAYRAGIHRDTVVNRAKSDLIFRDALKSAMKEYMPSVPCSLCGTLLTEHVRCGGRFFESINACGTLAGGPHNLSVLDIDEKTGLCPWCLRAFVNGIDKED